VLEFLQLQFEVNILLKVLFSNRNIERVLLFLLVNEKCYGTQLQTLLDIPLAPVQRALAHLEKNGVIVVRREGKMHIYRMNPAWPLRSELEALVKKAYLILPPDEKKQYCFVQKTPTDCRYHLQAFWKRLLKVERLNLLSKSQHMRMQVGKAEITSELVNSNVLVFNEKGYWYVDQDPSISFSSAFRWTLNAKSNLITLEHLRQGPNYPVFLFNLTASRPDQLVSIDAHLCGEDTYLGYITWDQSQITFHWRIIGPQKNDELIYNYT